MKIKTKFNIGDTIQFKVGKDIVLHVIEGIKTDTTSDNETCIEYGYVSDSGEFLWIYEDNIGR